MKRIFLDANVVIDLLGERYPWFPDALAQIIIVGLNKITQIATRMPQSERFVEDPREPAVNPTESV